MASVIRVSHGGGAAVEESHLTVEQARSLARSLAAVGEPAGCCWCVGLWDDEEEDVPGDPLSALGVSEQPEDAGSPVFDERLFTAAR